MHKDTVFSQPFDEVPPFKFDFDVSMAFDDMIERSIPYYHDIQTMICRFILSLNQSSLSVLDLGSATGLTAWTLSQALKNRSFRYLGVDNSDSMIDLAQSRFKQVQSSHDIQFTCCDLITFDQFPVFNVACSILTLHFLPIDSRLAFLQKICAQLPNNGMFIIVEKTKCEHSIFQGRFDKFYHGFKKDNGYSDLEIAQKRDAIEDVLNPLTMGENITLLQDAGFSKVDCFFKWLHFTGLIAVK